MTAPLLGVIAAFLASAGAYLIWTAASAGRAAGLEPRGSWAAAGRLGVPAWRRPGPEVRRWMVQAGLGEVGVAELVAAVGVMAVLGAAGAFVLFGGVLPPIVAAVFAAAWPVSSYRGRRRARLDAAAEAWPRMLDELRLLTGSLGRSIPQALFEVGRRAPAEWRPAFVAAEREWLLTTDFPRTVALLKDRLADATVDAVCETLVVAHEVGGTDLESRLAELVEDRNLDLQGRKDAMSRMAGVRFARRFVLLVPLGMAVAGLSIGNGRHAYETPGGQLAVVAGLVAIAVCWAWSGRLMRLPEPPRVFR
ncbi:MAG: type II secretion system F family protein [Acidimicrobiales bacterium]